MFAIVWAIIHDYVDSEGKAVVDAKTREEIVKTAALSPVVGLPMDIWGN